MIKIVFLLVLSVVLSAKVYDGVAVVIQDEVITLYDIKEQMKQNHIDKKSAVNFLIRRKLEDLEMKKRHISVTQQEVYNDIKELAKRNKMSVSEFYDAVRESNGLSSDELQKKIKEKLLTQKLYNAIAMSMMNEPTQEEIEEFYTLHKSELTHPSAFDVIIYDAPQKELLQKQQKNPMFYSSEIATNEQTLPFNRISPELASLLEQTPQNSFSPIVPNGKGGFMCFYIKSKASAQEGSLESVRPQIINALMAKKRQTILSDYFAHLRDNVDIRIIRLP